jgi:hypothetical protein
MSSGFLDFQYNGGAANQQLTTESGQSLVVNANPLFLTGGGSATNSPSGAATSSSSPTQAPSLSAAQANGLPPGTVLSAPAAVPLLSGAGGTASGSTWLILLLGLGAVLLLGGGGEGRHR